MRKLYPNSTFHPNHLQPSICPIAGEHLRGGGGGVVVPLDMSDGAVACVCVLIYLSEHYPRPLIVNTHCVYVCVFIYSTSYREHSLCVFVFVCVRARVHFS